MGKVYWNVNFKYARKKHSDGTIKQRVYSRHDLHSIFEAWFFSQCPRFFPLFIKFIQFIFRFLKFISKFVEFVKFQTFFMFIPLLSFCWIFVNLRKSKVRDQRDIHMYILRYRRQRLVYKTGRTTWSRLGEFARHCFVCEDQTLPGNGAQPTTGLFRLRMPFRTNSNHALKYVSTHTWIKTDTLAHEDVNIRWNNRMKI